MTDSTYTHATRRRLAENTRTEIHTHRPGSPKAPRDMRVCWTTWWLWRGPYTRSHPELGREMPQRPWYCVSRHGRVGRRQVFQHTLAHPKQTIDPANTIKNNKANYTYQRGVEQPGSSSGSYPEGHRFKSYPRNQLDLLSQSARSPGAFDVLGTFSQTKDRRQFTAHLDALVIAVRVQYAVELAVGAAGRCAARRSV